MEVGKKLFSNQRLLIFSPFLFVLVALQVIKIGLHPIGTDWIDWVRSAGKALPNYDSYLSKSVLPSLLSRFLPQDNYISWWIFYATILLIWISLVHNWIYNRYENQVKSLLILFFMLPGTISQFLFLGHYDIFIFISSMVAVVTSSRFIIVSASVICSLTNPEMTFVIGANLVLVSILIRSKRTLFVSIAFTFVSLFSVLLERFFFKEVKPDRVSINLDLWLPTIKVALPIWQLHAWALMSPILLGVLFYLERRLMKRDLLLLVPCLVIPLLFAMTIVDGTRVGATIGTSAIVASFLHVQSRTSTHSSINEKLYRTLFLIWLLVPAISVDVGGSLRLPYEVLLSLLINQI